ncbi:hypothetical protein [Neolewinella sp.]|uniref:hypothetical protein n=1 Tax=Neolewinella sp. TaxID=2993543 RepID=UPI003B51DF34
MNYLLPLLLLLLLTACTKDTDDSITTETLSADWQLQEFSITRATSGQEMFKQSDDTTWLLLNADGTYTRNYVNGTWVLDGKIIETQPLPDLGLRPVDYEVLAVSDEQLTIRYLTAALECNCGLESLVPGGEQVFRTDRFLKR